jgi:putative transposase
MAQARCFLGINMLIPGKKVWCNGEEMTLFDIKSITEVVLEKSTGEKICRPVADVKVAPPGVIRRKGDLVAIDTEKWQSAWEACRHIKALLAIPAAQRTAEDVNKVAKFLEKDRATIYRWIKRYTRNKSLSSLLRKPRNDSGAKRLPEEVEAIITKNIDTNYLTLQRRSMSSVAEDIKTECLANNLRAPDPSTVNARIRALDPKLVAEKRYGKKFADEKYLPLVGSIPNADYPLAIVQIDHTPMDVIVVDEIWRKPIQRPYLTIAIDVFSKMIIGFYISLDPPGALATGICISSAILGKEDYLAQLGLDDLSWDCWGIMRTIHTDNAKEFRGTMLGRAANEHGINTERRPKGKPRFGGTVERGFRTFMAKVHEELPGTTFSNVQDRVDYDSEGHACMTLAAVEKWFTIYLLGYYHQQPHKGNNNLPPVYVWEQAMLYGTESQPPTGVPARVQDEKQLRLDFLPYFERTVQEYGIQNWGLTWYSDSIRRLIHSRNQDSIKQKKKFICRYDPRDLSRISLYDDQAKLYIEVRFRDLTRPAVSLWEVRNAKRLNRAESISVTNETLIFKTILRMRKLVEEESELTKTARRQRERQTQWERSRKNSPEKQSSQVKPSPEPIQEDDFIAQPFDGIRES